MVRKAPLCLSLQNIAITGRGDACPRRAHTLAPITQSSVLAPAEGLSKWTLTSSRAAGSSTPSSSWALGTGINDVAVSPDGSKLAAACRDGTLRLIDLASGDVVGGTQSYYGALLCCCFNAAGSYVATGGEDDMVCAKSLIIPLLGGCYWQPQACVLLQCCSAARKTQLRRRP